MNSNFKRTQRPDNTIYTNYFTYQEEETDDLTLIEEVNALMHKIPFNKISIPVYAPYRYLTTEDITEEQGDKLRIVGYVKNLNTKTDTLTIVLHGNNKQKIMEHVSDNDTILTECVTTSTKDGHLRTIIKLVLDIFTANDITYEDVCKINASPEE